jgi:DNA polymerase I-like protein with 3'-5' exonuclease and polymerase domains
VNASGTKDEKVKAGQTIRNNMQKRLPALGKLMTNVKQRAKDRNYLVTIDGRTLPVRSEHSALNFLCQSAGAIICKQWVVTFHQMLRDRGYCNGIDYQQVAFVHDEVQVLCREGLGETIGSICIEAIQKAGEIVKLRLPLSGEFKVGHSWADTH